jgi:hypothetical protein
MSRLEAHGMTVGQRRRAGGRKPSQELGGSERIQERSRLCRKDLTAVSDCSSASETGQQQRKGGDGERKEERARVASVAEAEPEGWCLETPG